MKGARWANLVDVVLVDDRVEQVVELVEQRHDLQGRAPGGQGGEAPHVREDDRHPLEALRLERLTRLQFLRHHPADGGTDRCATDTMQVNDSKLYVGGIKMVGDGFVPLVDRIRYGRSSVTSIRYVFDVALSD